MRLTVERPCLVPSRSLRSRLARRPAVPVPDISALHGATVSVVKAFVRCWGPCSKTATRPASTRSRYSTAIMRGVKASVSAIGAAYAEMEELKPKHGISSSIGFSATKASMSTT